MMFPKFVPGDFTVEAKQELIVVLEKAKEFVWGGSLPFKEREREFICHAVGEVWGDDWDCSYFASLNNALEFIQSNIDASMVKSHKTFACWRETLYRKVHSNEPDFRNYVIDVQSHRKAWIDYLIQNLKETKNEVK